MAAAKILFFARTVTKTWDHADEEHAEHDPKMWHCINERAFMHCFVSCLHPRACVWSASRIDKMGVCMNHPCVGIAVLLKLVDIAIRSFV